VGLAPSKDRGIVIPITDKRHRPPHYWKAEQDELRAVLFLKRVLEDQTIRKVFQNGLYDIVVLYRYWGIKVQGFEEDTMLLHHALQPEALKRLDFLGSCYTDEGAWKADHREGTWKRDA
jgi:DNA polymerase I-like protein with 3'-5' exonuclease and polymerase domains